MPRVGREQSGTGIYHVMLRGINRQDIFEEPEDYWTFIKILSTVQERLEDDLVTRTTICQIDQSLDSPLFVLHAHADVVLSSITLRQDVQTSLALVGLPLWL